MHPFQLCVTQPGPTCMNKQRKGIHIKIQRTIMIKRIQIRCIKQIYKLHTFCNTFTVLNVRSIEYVSLVNVWVSAPFSKTNLNAPKHEHMSGRPIFLHLKYQANTKGIKIYGNVNCCIPNAWICPILHLLMLSAHSKINLGQRSPYHNGWVLAKWWSWHL